MKECIHFSAVQTVCKAVDAAAVVGDEVKHPTGIVAAQAERAWYVAGGVQAARVLGTTQDAGGVRHAGVEKVISNSHE